MIDKVKVLYVAGWGRSGSTILTNILGQIEGFVSVGEVNFLWEHGLIEDRLCGCGVPFKECPQWTAVLDEAFGDRVDPYRMVRLQKAGARTRHVPLMLTSRGRERLRSRLGEYLDDLGRLYGTIQETTGSRVIVDSSKFPSYGYTLGMAPNVDLYVLHLVRDPRAVAYSWRKKKVQPERAGGFGYMHRYAPPTTSMMWSAWNLSTEMLWARRSPQRYLRLRYEDFVEEPQNAVRRILSLLREESSSLPFASEREANLGVSHTISGNPGRFQTGTVELRPDEEWASQMKARDRALVTLLTFPLLVRYGYPLAGGDGRG